MTHKLELKKTGQNYEIHQGSNLLCRLMPIPAGSFKREDGAMVKVNAFYMAQFPVTQEFYEAVADINPSNFKGNQHPVEQVSWYEAVKFCGLLNKEFTAHLNADELLNLYRLKEKELDSYQMNTSSPGFRLPTEAELEYAAVGNKECSDERSKYAGSNILDMVGWHDKNNGIETKPVGLLFPNEFGIHDMSGNVFEWCWDWMGEYDKNSLENRRVQNQVWPV